MAGSLMRAKKAMLDTNMHWLATWTQALHARSTATEATVDRL